VSRPAAGPADRLAKLDRLRGEELSSAHFGACAGEGGMATGPRARFLVLDDLAIRAWLAILSRGGP